MLISEVSSPPTKPMKTIIQPARHNTKVRNNDIMHALPLKIFCWHSNMSHKHHKWSFCSIISVVIYPKCRFQLPQHDYTLSNQLPLNSIQTYQTTFLIQLQVFLDVNNRYILRRNKLCSIPEENKVERAFRLCASTTTVHLTIHPDRKWLPLHFSKEKH